MYVSHILDLIEMSPVNSELQLACLRLLTNLSVTNCHQHLMRNSVTLFLSLLVVSNESLQVSIYAFNCLLTILNYADVVNPPASVMHVCIYICVCIYVYVCVYACITLASIYIYYYFVGIFFAEVIFELFEKYKRLKWHRL